jgi:hypothetical protein
LFLSTRLDIFCARAHPKSLSPSCVLFTNLKSANMVSRLLNADYPQPGSPVLPIDVIEHIVDCLFETTPMKEPNASADPTTSICSIKPLWVSVSGLMEASIDLHNIGMERWVQVLTCRSQDDLEYALKYSRWIRYVPLPR